MADPAPPAAPAAPLPPPLDPAIAARIHAAVAAQHAECVAFLADLVRIPSTRGREAPVQDHLARALAARGYAVDRFRMDAAAMQGLPGFAPYMDSTPGQALTVVAAHRPARPAGRSLILQGHVDVVPEGPAGMWTTPPYEPVIRDGWMHGRGAGDMKGGVAAMIFALDALRAAGFAPAADLFVQTVIEEESTGLGALSTLARGYRADACLIPEPSGLTITRAHVGVVWFRLCVRGRPVHVARAEAGANAILSAYRLIEALQGLCRQWNERARSDPWFGAARDPLKFNPGVIRGGDWASSVPAWCDLDCRIGFPPGWRIADVQDEIAGCVRQAASGDAFLRENPPELVWNGFLADGYVLEPGSEAEAVLAGCHRAVVGAPMGERRSTAVNDTRFYGLYYGIPGLCWGPTAENVHGFDERVELASVRTATEVIARFVAAWCGLAPL